MSLCWSPRETDDSKLHVPRRCSHRCGGTSKQRRERSGLNTTLFLTSVHMYPICRDTPKIGTMDYFPAVIARGEPRRSAAGLDFDLHHELAKLRGFIDGQRWFVPLPWEENGK